ncbi:MAG: flagellar M-ring protein FliF [Candidatus Azotimanducaceae bacterium]
MDKLLETIKKLSQLTASRQIILLMGLALSISVGFGIVTWSQGQEYSVLFSEMDNKEVAEVVAILEQLKQEYRIDSTSGLISVPTVDKPQLRLRLATEGLPNAQGSGFDILYKEQEIGISAFMETARFNRALEEELAASVATLDSVRSARVHLAIPKKTSFIRKQQPANASVLVDLKPGRQLSEDQLAGIVYMIASSVPALDPEDVTLVDQKGRLLSSRLGSGDLAATTEHFKFTKAVEEKYVNSVMGILTPILGEESVRVKVNADVSFTSQERTLEQYDPRSLSLRSEQTVNESSGRVVATGAPGLVENDETGIDAVAAAERAAGQIRATRNYEIDHTISHIKEIPGTISRLSVAVVVDYKSQVLPDGTVDRIPLSDDEINAIRTLVREAVGFVDARGDSVNVTNAPFIETVSDYAELEALPIWQQPWIHSLMRPVLGFLGGLILLLAVVRPFIRSMTSIAEQVPAIPVLMPQVAADGSSGVSQIPQVSSFSFTPEQLQAAGYESQIAGARQLAQEDPTRVAQVLRNWVTADG